MIAVLVSLSKGRGAVLVVDHDVEVAVVVQVAERDPAADVVGLEIGPGPAGRQLEPFPSSVAV